MSSTQGHMIHSSVCNQEETLKPPILCEGRAADGLQGIHMQQLHQTHSVPASDVPLSLCTAFCDINTLQRL